MIDLVNKVRTSKLFKDSFWALLGNAIGKGLSVLGSIIVAHWLGKDLFGEYGLLKNTLLLIAIFSTMGLGYTSTIYVSKYKSEHPAYLKDLIKFIIKLTLTFSCIIALIVFMFAKQLAVYLEDPSLYTGLRCLSIIIIFNAITTSQIGILAGFKLFKKTAYINIISGILNFILSIILTYLYNFNGAIIALLISQIINCLLNYIILHKEIRSITYDQEKSPINDIIKSSIPIALQEMSLSITHWATSILLLKLTNYGEVGLYSAASQWSTIILFFPIVLRNVTLSYLSSTNQDNTKHNRILFTMIGIYFICTFIPASIISIFSKYISNFYGPSFNGLSIVLITTCYAAVFNSVFNALTAEFMSQNRNWLTYGISITRDCCILLLLYIYNTKFSMSGAFSLGLAMITMNLLAVIISIWFYKRLNSSKII